MGRRIDYHQDPDAPAVNSVRPSASAFVQKDGAVLLICRSDNGNWSLPGGAHDPGETLSRTAVRETKEETGIDIRVTGLVGIFTDPTHLIHYTSDDEVRQEFTVVYRGVPVDGQPTISDESTRVEWIQAERISALAMDPSQRKRIDWALTRSEPYLDPDTR
jgi:8-oxo-dGTP pyrophosphatase MutT (NUDIX family)